LHYIHYVSIFTSNLSQDLTESYCYQTTDSTITFCNTFAPSEMAKADGYPSA